MASGLPLQQGLQAGSSPDGSSPALAVHSGMIRARGAITDEQWNIFGKRIFSDREPVASGRLRQVRLGSRGKSLLRQDRHLLEEGSTADARTSIETELPLIDTAW